jgi:hypothetical protein
MTQPQDPKPRQPSRPELQRAIAGDEKVAPDVLKRAERRYDANATAAPKRSATLNGMVAPPAPGSAPPPPRLPGELAPTLPAKGNPLQHQTVQRPAPPSAMRQAVRSDPPPAHAPAAEPIVAPDDRQPVSIVAPHSAGRRQSPLPAPSVRPEDGQAAAQRREIERTTAERDKALAELQLERLRAQERAAERELELQGRLAEQQGEIEFAKASANSKPWIDERLVKALASLVTAMAALGVPFGIWLTAKSGEIERAQVRQAEKSKDTAATAGSAKAESSGTDKRVDELEKQLAAERAYNRAVWQRAGIEVPKRPGDPDPPKLDAEAPLRKPGTATKGAVLVVKTPPP